jgi:hypothetical protein
MKFYDSKSLQCIKSKHRLFPIAFIGQEVLADIMMPKVAAESCMVYVGISKAAIKIRFAVWLNVSFKKFSLKIVLNVNTTGSL